MNREEAMNVVAALRGDAAVVMGPGSNCGLVYERADRPATIYNMDMAYASAVALGIALARPKRPVLAIEGDGSFYAGSTVLSMIWRTRPANLTVLVTDNGVWGTGDGSEPTATGHGVDLAALARVAGWEEARVHRASDPDTLRRTLASALKGGGPNFIVASTDPAADQYLGSFVAKPRVGRHLLECAVLMRADLSRDD